MKTNLQSTQITLNYKGILVLAMLLILTNIFTFYLLNPTVKKEKYTQVSSPKQESLYLLNQAERFVYDVQAFEKKVRKISRKMKVPPEWLMAVMHSESSFDASVVNRKGSGATGLIQWMPKTAQGQGITVEKLRNLNHEQQLDFVYKYLEPIQQKYRPYDTLTDLYIAILYPKALSEDYCYTLYAKPSKAYEQNIGLDQDKDGRVTVQDVDKLLKRKYPKAYMVEKGMNISLYAKVLGLVGL